MTNCMQYCTLASISCSMQIKVKQLSIKIEGIPILPC